jgi:hypothetical protein
MQIAIAKRIDQLVELGWEPVATTETSASLHGRRPFSWWLFLFVVIFFPLFGGILYLIFWLATSRATVFLHQDGEQVHETGDLAEPQDQRHRQCRGGEGDDDARDREGLRHRVDREAGARAAPRRATTPSSRKAPAPDTLKDRSLRNDAGCTTTP